MRNVKIAAVAIVLTLVVVTFVAQPVSANPTTRRQSLRAYIDENYDTTEGGYSFPDQQVSRADPTWGAMGIFEEWGLLDDRPPVVDFMKLKNFTQKLHWTLVSETADRYGGFGEYIAGPVDQQSAYDGINLFDLLSSSVLMDIPDIDEIQLNGTAALYWINQTQYEDGGFSDRVDQPPDILSTYYALHSMEIALQTDEADTWEKWLLNRTAMVDWILSCRDGDAFKLNPDSERVGVTSTAAAVLALTILGESITEHLAIIDWLVSRQVTDETATFVGGFEETLLANDTNIESTYWALTALDMLGGIESVDADLAVRFIVDCQAADGSWGTVPGFELGSLYFAFYAIKSLNNLGTQYMDLLNEEDPNNLPPPLIDWKWVFVIGLIIIAAVAGLIALRLD